METVSKTLGKNKVFTGLIAKKDFIAKINNYT
jgi:hypothetical protein